MEKMQNKNKENLVNAACSVSNTGEYKIKFLTGIVDQELFSKASYVSNLFAA